MSKANIQIRFVTPPAFNLRMPESLKEQLREEAQRNGRSLNGEIIQRLRASFEGSWR